MSSHKIPNHNAAETDKLVRLAEELERRNAALVIQLQQQDQNRAALLHLLEELEHEQNRTEQARREWTQVFDAIRDPVFVHDIEYRVLRANRAYMQRASGDYKNILGRYYWEVFPRRQGPLPHCRNTGDDAQDVVTGEFTLDSGETFVSRAFAMRDADGRYLYAVHVLEDITEQKQQQEKLQRANRAFRALSACNANLIHAENEVNLFSDMCRVIVEEGGYRLAWVGYIASGSRNTVRPMAMAGWEGGSMELAEFRWNDNECEEGLMGCLVPEREAKIFRNIQGQPQLNYMHESARKGEYNSLVALPLRHENLPPLGVLYIYARESMAFDAEEVSLLEEIADNTAFGMVTLRTRMEHDRLQQEHIWAAERHKETLIQTIRAFALMVEKRDPFTAGHQHNVADLCVAIGCELGFDEDRLEGLRLGATIHDIGKVYIPAEILNRPGRLTPAEYKLVKSHPEVGYDIVKEVKYPWPVGQMILQHQERMDGSGYPKSLKNEEIILEARIIAVADVVEAMSSHRPYRPALGTEKALAEITANRGKLYDATVVDSCIRLLKVNDFQFA